MKSVAVALLALTLSGAAWAQPGPTGGTGGFTPTDRNDEESLESTSQPANGERLICRRVDTGGPSRMNRRRVCRTAAEWRASQRS